MNGSNQSIFGEIRCNSAPEFLDVLRNMGGYPQQSTNEGNSSLKKDWYFRGQGDFDCWRLEPNIWRFGDKCEGNKNLPVPIHERQAYEFHEVDQIVGNLKSQFSKSAVDWNNVSEAGKRICGELLFVKLFVERAASKNICIPDSELPEITISLIEEIVRDLVTEKKPAPYQRYWRDSAFSFAQHYGLLTRMLDWTFNPLVAAYFAAADGTNPKRREHSLAVYAVHQSVAQGTRIVPVIHKPGVNPYLDAQQGLFLLDGEADLHFIKKGSYPDFDTSLSQTLSLSDNVVRPKVVILPNIESHNLMRMLIKEHVTRMDLMPSLENAAKTVLDTQDVLLAQLIKVPSLPSEDGYGNPTVTQTPPSPV